MILFKRVCPDSTSDPNSAAWAGAFGKISSLRPHPLAASLRWSLIRPPTKTAQILSTIPRLGGRAVRWMEGRAEQGEADAATKSGIILIQHYPTVMRIMHLGSSFDIIICQKLFYHRNSIYLLLTRIDQPIQRPPNQDFACIDEASLCHCRLHSSSFGAGLNALLGEDGAAAPTRGLG